MASANAKMLHGGASFTNIINPYIFMPGDCQGRTVLSRWKVNSLFTSFRKSSLISQLLRVTELRSLYPSDKVRDRQMNSDLYLTRLTAKNYDDPPVERNLVPAGYLVLVFGALIFLLKDMSCVLEVSAMKWFLYGIQGKGTHRWVSKLSQQWRLYLEAE